MKIWQWLFRKGKKRADPKAFRASWMTERSRVMHSWFEALQSSGRPKNLRWSTFQDLGGEIFLEDEKEQFLVVVPVLLTFSPTGSEFDDIPQVHEPRSALAVIRYVDEEWQFRAQAILNTSLEQYLAQSGCTRIHWE